MSSSKNNDSNAGARRHEKVINPAGQQQAKDLGSRSSDLRKRTKKTHAITTEQKPTPTPKDPAILELAQNNDLSVETLQRQGNRPIDSDGEVTIDLR